MIVSSRVRSAEDKAIETPVRITQIRARRAQEESGKGLNRQI